MNSPQEREQEIRERCAAATPGKWWVEENSMLWQLFGGCPDDNTPCHGMQILKAPKQSEEYAEYWPNAGDAALIVNATADVTYLLARVKQLEAALEGATIGHEWDCLSDTSCHCGADDHNAPIYAALTTMPDEAKQG